MKIFPLFKKEKKPVLTPEEKRLAEEMEYAPQPDMQERVETEERVEETGEGIKIEATTEVTPEKGILRTDNLVKKYGKRTVAN
ncbi:MAG: hypothetical protein K2G69_01060, partial [Muribaculaceae bacterium]|nr:hypothetical protein [Muribaculaceae bacterium]